MKPNFTIRIRMILFLICVFAFVLIFRLYNLQITNGEVYVAKADRQYISPQSTLFDRGSIFFETKDSILISGASVKQGYTLAIHPNLILDAEGAYLELSKYIEIDKESFLQKAGKKNDPYEEILRKVEKEIGEKIQSAKIPGVRVYREHWRVYPGNNLASHAIGFIGFKGDEIAGRYGLERYYEDILNRTEGGGSANFFAEIFADIQNKILKGKNLQGDIVATIEPTVQQNLEETLSEIQKKWSSDSLGGIIINPKTGEIYAMGALPNFNPNDRRNETDSRVYSNPLVENVYEMGSIVKALTMAAGIDSKAVSSLSTYDDKGFLILNTKRISNYDGKGRGVVSMQEVLSQSLNTGVAHIVTKMGRDKFREYMLNFGLGELTGIDQPNEQVGIIKNLDSTREVEHATASFGQGIAISPIATVTALSSIANGGYMVKPHLVKKIEYKVGFTKFIEPEIKRQVITNESSEEITRMLVQVVDKSLRNGDIKMEHYSIAAKTGTAQIADSVNGGYYTDRYLHSFFGYFPAYEPQFLVFLYHVNPKNVQYASETLTYPFRDIVKFLISYYEIPPDR
jgi:stage V sporulation protein D (sporulation-specific penicillin-binding protein)